MDHRLLSHWLVHHATQRLKCKSTFKSLILSTSYPLPPTSYLYRYIIPFISYILPLYHTSISYPLPPTSYLYIIPLIDHASISYPLPPISSYFYITYIILLYHTPTPLPSTSYPYPLHHTLTPYIIPYIILYPYIICNLYNPLFSWASSFHNIKWEGFGVTGSQILCSLECE